jgi:hypothetical protein
VLNIQNIQPGDKTNREIHHFVLTINLRMMNILKQVLGVDVAQKELPVRFLWFKQAMTYNFYHIFHHGE